MSLRREKEEPEIDVGSFSDIAFLLIIFFILTTTFVKVTGNKMTIPSGTSEPEKKKEQKQITVNLRGKTIEFGEKSEVVNIEQLKGLLLKENFANRPEQERMVVLGSKEDVPYELYFQVVMAITKADGVIALIDYDEAKKE